MKKFSLISLFILSHFSFAQKGLNTQRERLFHCRNFGAWELVEELYIVESTLGRNSFYEVEVPYERDGLEKTFFRKLNLISQYDGRVLLFTTGNYRVKINRVFPENGKYKTFVRLPNFDVHSTDWLCKDY